MESVLKGNIMTHFDKIKSRMHLKTYWDILAAQSIYHWCRFCKALLPWCGIVDTCIWLFHYDYTKISCCARCLHWREVVESDRLQALQDRQWHYKCTVVNHFITACVRGSLFSCHSHIFVFEATVTNLKKDK